MNKKTLFLSKNLIKMKTKFIILIVLLTSVFVGCKDEKSIDDLKTVDTKVNTDNQIKVKLFATVKKDDKFQVYFSEEEKESEYKGENSVWANDIKGSDQEQEIVFLLPADVYPNYLRIEFGTNQEQENIKISGLKVEYLGKSIDASGPMFFDFFIPNNCISIIDKNSGLIKQNKSQEGIYDPLFFSGETLKRELKKIYY